MKRLTSRFIFKTTSLASITIHDSLLHPSLKLRMASITHHSLAAHDSRLTIMAAFLSGFVSIFGKPNAGKSTLLNAFIGEKMAIVSHKVQTTRHRIKGFVNSDNYQVIFS